MAKTQNLFCFCRKPHVPSSSFTTFVNITKKTASQLFPHDHTDTTAVERFLIWPKTHDVIRIKSSVILNVLLFLRIYATGERWISCLVRMIETRVSYRTWINYQTMSDLSGETNLANLSRIIRINYSVRRLWRMCVLFAFDPNFAHVDNTSGQIIHQFNPHHQLFAFFYYRISTDSFFSPICPINHPALTPPTFNL